MHTNHPHPQKTWLEKASSALGCRRRSEISEGLKTYDGMKGQLRAGQTTPQHHPLTPVKLLLQPTVNPHRSRTRFTFLQQAGNYAKVLEAFQRMKVAGFAPDAVTYTPVVDALFKLKRDDEAMEMFDEMRAHGLQPRSMTYGVMLIVCARNDMVGLAKASGFEASIPRF